MAKQRLSSYQKMKARYEAKIKELTDDVTTLIEDKDISKTTTVKLKYRILSDFEKAIFIGEKTTKMNGIFGRLKRHYE